MRKARPMTIMGENFFFIIFFFIAHLSVKTLKCSYFFGFLLIEIAILIIKYTFTT